MAPMRDLDVSKLLKIELNRRMTDNQNYSLRAFARSLDLDPSTLSKVLSGQRKLGLKAQSRLLSKMNFTKPEINDLFSQISDLDFEAVSEWYDTALLELLTVSGFKATQKSIAVALELNERQVESALSRLLKTNMICISKTGVISDATVGETTNITPQSTTLAKRNLQKQFLEKAQNSIDKDPLDLRDMTTITCAIDTKKIPEAKTCIKAFRRQMSELLTSGRKANQIYNISISMYPLSKNLKEIL